VGPPKAVGCDIADDDGDFAKSRRAARAHAWTDLERVDGLTELVGQARACSVPETAPVRVEEQDRAKRGGREPLDEQRDLPALNLGYTTITAPVDGTVGLRTLRVGEYVQAGTQLMAVVPLQAVYIVANYKETQLTDVRSGQKATVDIDTFPGTTVHGYVDSLAPASGEEFALLPPDNATGNFTKIVQRIPVKIAIDVNDPLLGRLRPGMSVEPTIDTKGSLAAPASARAP